jgi:glycosyltransferase involved in cell wall biosynthesis
LIHFPKISIVTPSFNQGQFLEETIRSVLDQNYPNLEYIVIDGGSSDNSVDIIKKYRQHLTFWVSEKDKGQANAINKGLQISTGTIFNWLNSDDYLEPGALHKIAAAFADEQVQMVAGKVRNFSTTEQEIIPNQNLSAIGLICWEKGVKFVQPGVWMRRGLIEPCGGIDEQFHFAFDWDLYIRYLYNFPYVKEIDDLLVHFRLHDESKTQSLPEKFLIEQNVIIEKLYYLKEFERLKKYCDFKIQQFKWTKFLSELSKSHDSHISKILVVIGEMNKFKKVAYTRQTLGAIRAFLDKRVI